MINNFKNIPKRYCVVLLLFISDMLKSYINTCPVLVIAEITADRKIVLDNKTQIIPAEFDWTTTQRGIALGTHAVGPIFSVLGGTIVHRIGGAILLSVGMLGVAILTLVDPFVMRIHVYLFTAARLVFGFFEGLTFVGSTDVMTRWTPKHERVRALTFTYIGYGFGSAITFPLSGLIIHHLGWPAVFYTYGAVNLIWCFLWITFVSNDPASDKFISEKERDYLTKEIKYDSENKVGVPYKDIFTSIPVYALLNEFFVAFIILSFMKFLPLYLKDLYDTDIQLVGLISSIPQFSTLLMQIILAYVADYIRKSDYSIGKLHQWFLFWGKSFAILFYFLTSIINDVICSIVCISLAEIFFSLARVCYSSIIIDITGQHAGFVQSLVVVAASIALFLNPIFVGLIIRNHSQSEWNTYFLSMSLLLLYSLVVFLIFGSGDLQPWAKVPSKVVTEKNSDESDCTGRTSRDDCNAISNN